MAVVEPLVPMFDVLESLLDKAPLKAQLVGTAVFVANLHRSTSWPVSVSSSDRARDSTAAAYCVGWEIHWASGGRGANNPPR